MDVKQVVLRVLRKLITMRKLIKLDISLVSEVDSEGRLYVLYSFLASYFRSEELVFIKIYQVTDFKDFTIQHQP